MKKLLILAIAALSAGVLATAAIADHRPGHPAPPGKAAKGTVGTAKAKPAKIEVCHRTMAGEDAHHTIRISERAWPAHERHGDSKQACDSQSEPAGTTAVGTTLSPVGAPGAAGAGTFHLDIRLLKNGRARLCYTLSVTGLEATLAQIRTLVAQNFATATDVKANAIVARLKAPASGIARGCVLLPREVAADIRVNPGEYFVNVPSAAFPGGQIQGTLAVDA